MMKIMIYTGLMLLIALTACKEKSFREAVSFKSLRSFQTGDIEELKKKALEYEGDAGSKPKYVNELGNIYYKLGLLYLEKKNWDEAVASFKKATGYGKDSPSTYYNLAVAYGNRGRELGTKEDLNSAEKNYRLAIEKNAAFSDARYGLGILLFYEKDQKEDGLRIMEQLVSRNSDYIRGYFALGRFYYELNKPEKALAVYEALHGVLEKKSDRSEEIKLYKQQCRDNIERLMRELSGQR